MDTGTRAVVLPNRKGQERDGEAERKSTVKIRSQISPEGGEAETRRRQSRCGSSAPEFMRGPGLGLALHGPGARRITAETMLNVRGMGPVLGRRGVRKLCQVTVTRENGNIDDRYPLNVHENRKLCC